MGLLHTGKAYPDDLSEDGVLYHYPETTRPPGRDSAEVSATKTACELELPVFVVTPGLNSAERTVHLGWVQSWDDRSRLFLISFGERPCTPTMVESETEGPFALTEPGSRRTGLRELRQGQTRFKFLVLKRYGPACAVCGISILAVLDAAHVCPKESKGCDDPRNGLVLCSLHHRALDAGLFAIEPDTMELHYGRRGPAASQLRVTFNSLHHLSRYPHRDALEWLWNKWRSQQSGVDDVEPMIEA